MLPHNMRERNTICQFVFSLAFKKNLGHHPAMTLHQYLQKTGTTQAALAAKIGVSQSRVSRWLRGEVPRLQTLMVIKAATDGKVKPGDFLK